VLLLSGQLTGVLAGMVLIGAGTFFAQATSKIRAIELNAITL
jgi:hypothetical protein